MTFSQREKPIDSYTWEEKEKLYKIIQSQKELLEDIHSNIDDVIWIAKFNPFEILYINNACEKVHGYAAEEMMANPNLFKNNIHPDDSEKFLSCIEKILTTGKSHCEFRVLHKDGKYRHLKTQGTLKKGNEIHQNTISGIAIDITMLRETENALKEKIEEVEAILGSISDAFCAVDEHWNFTYVNKTFCNIFNVIPDIVLNNNLLACFPELIDSFFYSGMISAKENKQHVHMEGLSLTMGKMLSVSFYPFKNGLAMYIIDISDKVIQRKTIIQQQEQLTDIARFQSHQVRGPVATILGLAQLINVDNPNSNLNKNVIEGLIDAAHELDRSIRQIDMKTQSKDIITA